jgi:formate-dependent nitrite reductase membrane component NrfD
VAAGDVCGVATSAVLSLVLLVLQDVLTTVEPEGSELHHLFVFDVAWPVFLIARLATLIAGVAAMVVDRLRSDAQLTRYGVWAVAFLVVAVLVIVVTESLQPPAPEHS